MRYGSRRNQAAFAHAIASASGEPRGHRWGEGIEVGVRVTSFGRHGAGQPAVDGEVVQVDGQHVTIRTRDGDRTRTISNVRKVGR